MSLTRYAIFFNIVAFLLQTLCAGPCQASAFVFMKVGTAVWLVSDTLVTHNDGKSLSTHSGCKVAISSGRLVANIGYWTNLRVLLVREAVTPQGTMTEDADRIAYLAKSMYMSGTEEAKIGIVRSNANVLEAEILFLGRAGRRRDVRVYLREGIPFGSGQTVEEARDSAMHDSSFALKLAKNPKKQLVALLSEEARRFPEFVGGPFSILKLNANGKVEDLSDNLVCK